MVATFEQIRTKGLKTFDELRAKPKPPDYGTAAIPKEKLPGVWDYDKQLDDLLGDNNIELEDMMPLDVRYDFGKIVGMTEKPDETKDRMKSSLFYSILLNKPPKVTFNLLDELNKIAFKKPIDVKKAMAEYSDYYLGSKNYVGAIKHGFRHAGAMMTKQLAGAAKMTGELTLPTPKAREKKVIFPEVRDWGIEQSEKLKGWGDMMLAAVEEYYRENKAEAIQITPGIGYWDTLNDYITEPTNLVQGIVESSPLILEGILGNVFGGTAGAITTMSVPISGEVYADARKEGTDVVPAMGQAIFTGTGEAAIEQWTLSRKLGLMKNFKRIVADGLPKITWEGVKVFFRGTAEEGSQQLWRNFWQWLFTDRSQQWTENVKESMAAGGPMELAMAGVFSSAGVLGPAVAKEQQLDRIDKIQEAIQAEPTLTAEHKTEIQKELDTVREDVESDVYKPPAEEAIPAPEQAVQPQKPAEGLELPPKPVEAQPVAKAEPFVKKEVSPIIEPELTKQEESDITRLEAEIEEPFEMVRVKDVGFVIKEKATGKEAVTIAKRKEAKKILAEYNQGERKVRETRRKPKLLTEKATIGKLITEARALKAAMKKVAQAARKAYQVGKGEGIAKVKAYYYDIRQREQARKQLKKRITKAVKTITKDIPKSVDFNYREAIENLQAGIDPQFRTEKTLQMRERTREFLAQTPEALKDMPVKLLNKLAQKPMSEYTIEEVEKIAEEIERLTKQGKLKRKLRLAQKERKLTKTTQELSETISKGEKINFESEPVTYETTKEGLVKTAYVYGRSWTLRPSRIFDMLDGMKDFAGKAHRTFIDQVNTAINDKLRAVDKRKDAGIAKMKELGITPRDLAQVRTIDDVRYMVDEMIGIYCASKNRLAKLALMYGNNLNEKMIDNVIANLTENEKAWGDHIIQDYENRKDVLREKVIEVENRDMGYEENYTPIRRTEVDYSTHTEEIVDAILQIEHLRRAYAEHGFTVHR